MVKSLAEKQSNKKTRTAAKCVEALVDSVSKSDIACREVEFLESIEEIVGMLKARPKRIKRVKRALKKGVFDGQFLDPKQFFNVQYRFMYRVPLKHCRSSTLPKMAPSLVPLVSAANSSERKQSLKLVLLGTRTTAKSAILARNKDDFDNKVVELHDAAGKPLLRIPLDAPIDFSTHGAWSLDPARPDGVECRAHLFTHFVLWGEHRYEIPDAYAIRGTWTLASNWDFAMACVDSGKRKWKIMGMLSKDDQKAVYAASGSTQIDSRARAEECDDDDEDDEGSSTNESAASDVDAGSSAAGVDTEKTAASPGPRARKSSGSQSSPASAKQKPDPPRIQCRSRLQQFLAQWRWALMLWQSRHFLRLQRLRSRRRLALRVGMCEGVMRRSGGLHTED